MLKIKITLISFLLFVLVSFGKAQDSSVMNKHSFLKLSGSYLTNSVYNGRKDSAVLPYLTPSLEYYNKTGFYAVGSLSYSVATGDSRIGHNRYGLFCDY